MNNINPFNNYAVTAATDPSTHSLDAMMQQRLQSQPSASVFADSEDTAAQEAMAKKKFLQRYIQAIEGGKFILIYDNDEEKKNKQFAADLELLYSLMLPAKEDELDAPTMAEMENWLIALFDPDDDKAGDKQAIDHTPTNDEKNFLMLAYNNFRMIYKKHYENMIDKIKEEMIKPLSVSWDQPYSEPEWPSGTGEYTPTAHLSSS
ncbi:hypothetical protein [Pantoea cypripedii]|uniref:Uncharacterized protein n=1 Tax=Pantoea cypripedii TaxID=55209 RepID=A0A6B9GFM5_PANCY|nr:hypothetical protein [Pantoea cypripedii]QGY32205.1 hypothetical protein CUN67_24745 [Pantoea cypripedii]